MSLYQDPTYFSEHLTDMRAPEEVSPSIEDLDPAFKSVLDPESFNELTHLRKKFGSDNKSAEAKSYAPQNLTSPDMKISAN